MITHQSFGRTCSDAFAASLASALNALDQDFRYLPDNTGVYTDTNEYAGHIAECTNLSVGYHGQHGPRETLDVDHCERLLAAMLRLDASKLVIERDPQEDDLWGWHDSHHGDRDDFADTVAEYPLLAAQMLENCGVTLGEFVAAIWADEMDGDRRYHALTMS